MIQNLNSLAVSSSKRGKMESKKDDYKFWYGSIEDPLTQLNNMDSKTFSELIRQKNPSRKEAREMAEGKSLVDLNQEMIPLSHAAEVLAKEYRRHRDEVIGIRTGLLSSSACDEDQNRKDYNRAIEELKK